jgi:subtilisin family serine protease
MVMSAGNDPVEVGWPSQIPAAFAVAGLSSNGAKWALSTYGTWVDVSAAAENVPLIDPILGVATGNGTSGSSPAVTGTIALLLSEDATFPAPDLRRLIQLGAVSVDALNPTFAGKLGAGFVNTHRSLLLLEPVTDLGGGLAGATAPHLHAYGGTQLGDTFAISVNFGPPGALTGLVVGTAATQVPAFGGIVVPSFNILVFALLDADGRFHAEFPLPASLPAGVTVAWMQALVKDVGAPKGVAISNAVSVKGL